MALSNSFQKEQELLGYSFRTHISVLLVGSPLNLPLITRSFQTGAGRYAKFDEALFEHKLQRQLLNFLDLDSVSKILVVTNGDPHCKFSEKVEGSHTETGHALARAFPAAVESGKLEILLCDDWGVNAGSATAINTALASLSSDTDTCAIVSAETSISDSMIYRALEGQKDHNLKVVGFLRENWWKKTQWNIAQNTAAIWDMAFLRSFDFFDRRCNGSEQAPSTGDSLEQPLIAGMEDFHLLLRALKANKLDNWGMCGVQDPFQWDTDFSKASSRIESHEAKVARQYLVMQEYCRELFPERNVDETIGQVFKRFHCF